MTKTVVRGSVAGLLLEIGVQVLFGVREVFLVRFSPGQRVKSTQIARPKLERARE